MTTNLITTETVREKLLSEFESDKNNLTAQELFLYQNAFNILSFIDESREESFDFRSKLTKSVTEADTLGYRLIGALDEKTRNWIEGICQLQDIFKKIANIRRGRSFNAKN